MLGFCLQSFRRFLILQNPKLHTRESGFTTVEEKNPMQKVYPFDAALN